MYAAAAEYKQTHPIALAILEEASNRDLRWPEIELATLEIGYGIKAHLPKLEKEIAEWNETVTNLQGLDVD